jgi:hypothetical protein
MRKSILIIFWFALVLPTASAENLDRLIARAQRYLDARASGNKIEMERFVPTDKRNELLNRTPPPMSNPKVEGLELTSDPKTVYVMYSATYMIQDVGPFTTRVKAAWNWNGKDWFLEIKPGGNFLEVAMNTQPQPVAKPLPFELNMAAVDLGKHVQGEVVRQSIGFKADKEGMGAFRHNALKGLQVTGPTWTSKENGQLEIALDTSLIDTDVKYPVELDISAQGYDKTRAKFELTAEIEPRLRFSQTPEIIDPTVGGTVEIQVQNVSNVSFKPRSLILSNTAYQISDYTPSVVESGKTFKIVIKYQPQPDPSGVALNVETSPAVLAKANFTLPINVKLPTAEEPTYSKQQLDDIIKRSR